MLILNLYKVRHIGLIIVIPSVVKGVNGFETLVSVLVN